MALRCRRPPACLPLLLQRIFSGPGRVLFRGSGFELNPTWFNPMNGVNGLQQASNSCGSTCVVMLTRPTVFDGVR